MTNPTQITTPGGTRLTVPLAWTCWTHEGCTYRRLPDDRIVRRTRWGSLRVWTGRVWGCPTRAQAQDARFLEMV